MSQNIDNTKKAYAAFAEGDIATVSGLIAPDCIWHVGGRSQLAGDYVGQEQILGYFAKLFELTEGTFQVTLDDVGELESGLVACVTTATASKGGATITNRMMEISNVNEAGQVQECWWFAEDQYAADELFGTAEIRLPESTPV